MPSVRKTKKKRNKARYMLTNKAELLMAKMESEENDLDLESDQLKASSLLNVNSTEHSEIVPKTAVKSAKCKKLKKLPLGNNLTKSKSATKSAIFEKTPTYWESLMNFKKLEESDSDEFTEFARSRSDTIGDGCHLKSVEKNPFHSTSDKKISKMPRLMQKSLEISDTGGLDESLKTAIRAKKDILNGNGVRTLANELHSLTELRLKLDENNLLLYNSDSRRPSNDNKYVSNNEVCLSPKIDSKPFAEELVDDNAELSYDKMREQQDKGSGPKFPQIEVKTVDSISLAKMNYGTDTVSSIRSDGVSLAYKPREEVHVFKTTERNLVKNNCKKTTKDKAFEKDSDSDQTDSADMESYLKYFNGDFIEHSDDISTDGEEVQHETHSGNEIIISQVSKDCSMGMDRGDELIEDFNYFNYSGKKKKITDEEDVGKIDSFEENKGSTVNSDRYVRWHIKKLPYILVIFALFVLIFLCIFPFEPICYNDNVL